MSQFNKLFHPDSTPGSSSGSVPTTEPRMDKEDVIEFLGADDESTEILEIGDRTKERGTQEAEDKGEDDKDKGDEKETEEDEIKELEKELEGPTEEQLELVTPVRRREILAKYPTLFKDFPYLEKAYYREQQFTELLPTIDDAKIAVGKAQVLDRFEADVGNGNIKTVLEAVKNDNPEGFARIADNYMQTLAAVDQQAYHHVLGNIIKHTIVAMVHEGKNSQNEALTSAAQILNQFVFASSNFTPPTALAKPRPQEDNELEVRQREFNTRQLTTAVEGLNTKVNNTLKNTVESNIDPRNSMSDYVRSKASKDALEKLEDLFSKDSRFRSLTDKLWEQAIQANFSENSVGKIKSAYLAKAKTLLPAVIKQARTEALRGTNRRISNDDSETTHTESPDKKGPIPSGRPRSNTSGKISKASDIPKGMRTLDFLMQD